MASRVTGAVKDEEGSKKMMFIISIIPLILGLAVVIMALIRKLKPLSVKEENVKSDSDEISTARISSSTDWAENIHANIPDRNRLKVHARSTKN